MDICKKNDKEFDILREDCIFLNALYIDTRYPDVWPVGRTRQEAEKAREAAKRIRDFVKRKLLKEK